ncbi:MAG: hypothetical protein M5U09_14440 [Gammaproteobacteria bacterium]|nr:hypothetical protein [Gammaproteobacteria bacterium]
MKDAHELEQTVRQLVEDANHRFSCGQNGITLIDANQGALVRTLEALEPFLGKMRQT